MISADGVRAIIAQYEKFGWRLRRVLVTEELREYLGNEISGHFRNADVVDSDLDAAWFSRPSRGAGVAWEVRMLDDLPFALVEVVDVDDDDALEGVLLRLENDLRSRHDKRSSRA